MAIVPQTTPGSAIEEAFVADRLKFWARFTKFTTGAAAAVVVLLVFMWIFIA